MYIYMLKKQRTTTADGVRRAVDRSAHRELNFVIEHVLILGLIILLRR